MTRPRSSRTAAPVPVAATRSSRRKAAVAGAPRASKAGGKPNMAKEEVPGLLECFLPVALVDGETTHEGAYKVGVYVKHEKTVDALSRLGIPTTGAMVSDGKPVLDGDGKPRNHTLATAVDAATAAGETRRYNRLPDCPDQPEAIGAAWYGVKASWPFTGVAVPQRDYASWECYETQCSAAFCDSADLALTALEAHYDFEGKLIVK